MMLPFSNHSLAAARSSLIHLKTMCLIILMDHINYMMCKRLMPNLSLRQPLATESEQRWGSWRIVCWEFKIQHYWRQKAYCIFKLAVFKSLCEVAWNKMYSMYLLNLFAVYLTVQQLWATYKLIWSCNFQVMVFSWMVPYYLHKTFPLRNSR